MSSSTWFGGNKKATEIIESADTDFDEIPPLTAPIEVSDPTIRELEEKMILNLDALEKCFNERIDELEVTLRKELPQNIIYSWWIKTLQFLLRIVTYGADFWEKDE